MCIYCFSCGSPLWGKLGTCSLKLLSHGAPTLCQDLHQVLSLMGMVLPDSLALRDWGGATPASQQAGKVTQAVIKVHQGWGRL